MGDLKHAEATLRNLHHTSASQMNAEIERCSSLQQSFQSLSKNATSFKHLLEASSQISQCHEENIANEIAVSNHRRLDAFSGRWDECNFSSGICRNLLSQANAILKENHVKQSVGIRQLDHSSCDDDQWSDLADWSRIL